MGLDHLGPSLAVLFQFMSRLAQEPLMQGTETPCPPSPQMKQAAVAKQTPPDCTWHGYHKKKEESSQPAGRQEQQRYQVYPLLSASSYGVVTVVKIV